MFGRMTWLTLLLCLLFNTLSSAQLPSTSTTEKAKNITEKGFAALHSGNDEQAMKLFDEAIKIDPLFAGAYNGKGFSFWKRGYIDKALTEFGTRSRIEIVRARIISQPY